MTKQRKGIKELVAEAGAAVETWSLEEAMARHGDDDVVMVDVRDIREVWRDGTIEGAFHAPRDMIEFWVDPESPYAKPIFQSGKRFMFFCASGDGWRSGLSAKAVQDMGLKPVCRMTGGFKAWQEAGGPVEQRAPKKP